MRARTVYLTIEIGAAVMPLPDMKDAARHSLAYLGAVRTVTAHVAQPSKAAAIRGTRKAKKAARR